MAADDQISPAISPPPLQFQQRAAGSKSKHTIEPVVEHADRQTVHLFGILLPAHNSRSKDLAGDIKGTVVEIDDAEVLAQRLGKVRLVLLLKLEGAKGLVKGRIGLDGGLVHLEPHIAESRFGLDGLDGLDGLGRR